MRDLFNRLISYSLSEKQLSTNLVNVVRRAHLIANYILETVHNCSKRKDHFKLVITAVALTFELQGSIEQKVSVADRRDNNY